MLVAASTCTAVELRREVSLDEIRDQEGKPCAPKSLHARYFAKPALRENGEFGTVLAVGKGEAPTPRAPTPELHAPIRSVAAARRTGEWDGPGGWREALEGEIGRVFVLTARRPAAPAPHPLAEVPASPARVA